METTRNQGLMMVRTCRKCNREQSINEFSLSHPFLGKDWRRHICKTCERERCRKWNALSVNREKRKKLNDDPKRREARKECARKYRIALKKIVYMAYGNKCNCCGEKEQMFLTIDHINNDGSFYRKNSFHSQSSTFYKWIIANNFPPEFQILCLNCNVGKYKNNGVCPHQSRLRDYPAREYDQAIGSAPHPVRDDDIVRPA